VQLVFDLEEPIRLFVIVACVGGVRFDRKDSRELCEKLGREIVPRAHRLRLARGLLGAAWRLPSSTPSRYAA
jgi:hypothetical protein